jgi:lysyl-tRNA synthetase class 1
LPNEASGLDAEQRAFLAGLADTVAAEPPLGGDGWQDAIFKAAEAVALPAGRAFAALYLVFLGRTNGPRAGWLLASLDPGFVVDRLREAAAAQPATVGGPS